MGISHKLKPKGFIEMAEEKITKITELEPACLKVGDNLTQQEFREKAEALARAYTDAIQNGSRNPVMEYPKMTDGMLDGSVEIVNIYDVMEDAVEGYNAIAHVECFKALKATADPMLEAVKQLTYPIIRTVEHQTGEGKDKLPVVSIEDGEKAIDILKLHNAVKGGIGANKQWPYMIEKFNFLMTAQKAVDLGIDPKEINDSYAMNAISREIDMGKTPTSKTNILRTLGTVISAMIGEEYKPTSHDVNFLMSIYSRKSRKALTVTCANHKYMRQYLAEVCHRIVLGEKYNVDYKKAKPKK